MAGLSSFLKVTVLGDSKPLNTAMRKAMRDIDQLERSVKKTAVGISRAMGAIGIGFGIQGLGSMAKAAIEDQKSMVKLETAIRNATGATDAQIASNEQYIQGLSNQLGITDDELRPALQKLVLATGDLTKAQALLPLAADLAASANIDLTTAANALSKAQNGNMTALYKLMPALKGVKDPMAELQRLTDGAAEAAANTDPWKRIQIIFENLQETLGAYLLPYLQQFADWLNSDDGQEKLQMLVTGFTQVFNAIASLVSFLGDNTWIVSTITGLIVLIKVWKQVHTAIKAVYALTKANTIAQMVSKAVSGSVGWTAIIAGGAALAAGIGIFLGIDAMLGDGLDNLKDIKPPTEKKFQPVPVVPLTPGTVPGVGDGSKSSARGAKALKKADTALKDAIKTVEAKLQEVRSAILQMVQKFFSAVELGFGIVQRGAAKVFRADRYVRELRRMKIALADFQANLAALQKIGGAQAKPLLNQILGMSPEEGASILRGFVQSPELFREAVATTGQLGRQGAAVGRMQSLMQGNQTEVQMLAELRLLRAELASGKNTYNIKSEMTAEQILASIRSWEKKSGKKVLR